MHTEYGRGDLSVGLPSTLSCDCTAHAPVLLTGWKACLASVREPSAERFWNITSILMFCGKIRISWISYLWPLIRFFVWDKMADLNSFLSLMY